MIVDNDLLIKVAGNARIKLNEQEQKELLPQLKEIINFFESLSKADVNGVKPSFHPVKIKNSYREDKQRKCLTQDQALSNVRQEKEGFIKGPRILE